MTDSYDLADRPAGPAPGDADEPGVEYVVLLDDDGRPVGRARKDEVHHRATPLHLAFSCWLLDEDGRTLLTQRSPAKRTWPGIWTNSFCGHPGPGEAVEDAVHRRAWDELGARIGGLELRLPSFRYRAVMADGTVENEVCPVYTARLLTRPVPDPDEIADLRWTPVERLRRDVLGDPDRFSPWLREQLPQLRPLVQPPPVD